MSNRRNRRNAARQGQRAQPQRIDRVQPLPAGSHLGELGQAHDQIDISFGWFGADVRINPDLGPLDVVDFLETGMEIDEEDPRQLTVIKDFMRSHIHPDDFEKFWTIARKQRQDAADLMKLSQDILQAASGHPTGRQSDSSNGQSTTPPTSVDASSVEVEEDAAMPRLTSRVIARLEAEGRPDLAEAVMMRHESSLAG